MRSAKCEGGAGTCLLISSYIVHILPLQMKWYCILSLMSPGALNHSLWMPLCLHLKCLFSLCVESTGGLKTTNSESKDIDDRYYCISNSVCRWRLWGRLNGRIDSRGPMCFGFVLSVLFWEPDICCKPVGAACVTNCSTDLHVLGSPPWTSSLYCMFSVALSQRWKVTKYINSNVVSVFVSCFYFTLIFHFDATIFWHYFYFYFCISEWNCTRY